MESQANARKLHRSWSMYDWANSAYNLVITSTIFPAYYTIITSDKNNDTIDYVTFLGMRFVNSALYNYALAFAFLVIALLSPVLSSIADSRGNKKLFMKVFTYMGSLACCGLYFFEMETLQLSIVLFIVAAIGFWGSLVFYNAYLPEIASPDQQDKVSATGYAYGYVGSIILQLMCFVFVFFPTVFGLSGGAQASRLSFLMVGIWWMLFAQIPFKNLPSGNVGSKKINKNVVKSGFQELSKVWKQLSAMKFMKLYLLAFFFYSMGVQTIMLAAAGFGEKTLELGTSKLIATILIIQLVAILGAMVMSYFARRVGNVRVLIWVVVIWIGACFCGYYVANEYQFYGLAALVGLIMGGIQSLSRSTYSKYIPEDSPDSTSFFSFYDVTEKLAIVIGLFSFAFIEELTGNMRNSIIALAGFFIIGLIFLLLLRRYEKKIAGI